MSKVEIPTPNHVALLVRSVRRAATHLATLGFQIGEEAEFESEGTREIYVEKDQNNSLLLLEAIKPGPYLRALEKRGPGLHHLAIDVLNLESYIDSLSGSGWLLHPMSLQTIKHRTAYLARPGFPGLIEVQQREAPKGREVFVKEVAVPFESKFAVLLGPIGLENIVRSVSATASPYLKVGGHVLPLSQIL